MLNQIGSFVIKVKILRYKGIVDFGSNLTAKSSSISNIWSIQFPFYWRFIEASLAGAK